MSQEIGRPTLLTPALQDEISRYLQSGVTVETACAACGISAATYRSWLKQGKDELKRVEATNGARVTQKARIYVDFLAAVERTLATVQARLAGRISESASGYDVEKVQEIYERDGNGNSVLVERKVTRSRERDWRAAAWLLERRHPADFGQQIRQEHSGQVSVIGIDIHMPAEDGEAV